MNNKVVGKRTPFISIIFLVIFLLSGCGLGGGKTRKPSGDFSRGLSISTVASSSPAVAIDPTGAMIRVVVPYQKEEDQVSLRYVLINDKAGIDIDKDIPIDFGQFVRSPKMIASQDQVHLIWAARESTTEGWRLWITELNPLGEIIIEPKSISEETGRVSQFGVIEDGTGGAVVFWEDNNEKNIKYSRITPEGKILSPPEVLISKGERPSANLSTNGFHFTWMVGDKLFYSQMNEESEIPLQGDHLVDIKVGTGNRMDGPVIGSTLNHVLIFWSILRQTGLEAGTAITEYLVFPVGRSDQIKRDLVTVYPTEEGLFQPFQGNLSLTEIIKPPAEDYYSTDFVYDPRVGRNENSLVVAVCAGQAMRLDSYVQVLIGVFEDGKYLGYTPATKTKILSQNAQIGMDNQGNLHLVWQDGNSANRVYYATNAPKAKSNLDQVAFSDLSNVLLSGGLEALTGILLFPFAFPWMIVGLVILIIWRLVQNDEDVTHTTSKILLGICLVIYQMSKILFLPDILVYVPFSAWVDIPIGVGATLKIVVPVVIFMIGFGVAEWIRRNRLSPPSSLMYYFFVILVDVVLTLAVYGVIFLGEY